MYENIISKILFEYLDGFMLFLEDFTLLSEMDNHFPKLRKCFEKCMEFGIILNLDKCLLLVIFDIILGFIISKEDRLPNPKEIEAKCYQNATNY